MSSAIRDSDELMISLQHISEESLSASDLDNLINLIKDECLTSTQPSGYFRRMAASDRSGGLHRREEVRPAPTEPVPEGGESEDEEKDPYEAEAPLIRTRLQIRRELEL